jgi:hypothetical protein
MIIEATVKNLCVMTNGLPEIHYQQQAFSSLREELGTVPLGETKSVLAQREVVHPEAELSADTISRFQQRIHHAHKS